MKKIKLLLTSLLLTVAFTTPVFATETTLPAELKLIEERDSIVGNALSTVVSYDNNCGAEAKLAIHSLVDIARGDLKSSQITEAANYINYLKALLSNKLETERIKKQNVAALTDLVKVNPTFQTQLDAAVVEYNNAVADRVAVENAIVESQKILDEHASKMINNVAAKGALDADTIK